MSLDPVDSALAKVWVTVFGVAGLFFVVGLLDILRMKLKKGREKGEENIED